MEKNERKEIAIDATWDRMGRLSDTILSAAKDIQRGVVQQRGYVVAMGLISIAGALTEALRLQGRIDQTEENQAEEIK